MAENCSSNISEDTPKIQRGISYEYVLFVLYVSINQTTLSLPFYLNHSLTKKQQEEVRYGNYLKLDKILGSQDLLSQKILNKASHDEHLFIIIHQGKVLYIQLS